MQVGSRFVASVESSAHQNFKDTVLRTQDGDTHLTLKELTPVRLIKNDFYHRVQALYEKKAGVDELRSLLGRARAKIGMFEGDLVEGELEIGQIAGLIDRIMPAAEIVQEFVKDYNGTLKQLSALES